MGRHRWGTAATEASHGLKISARRPRLRVALGAALIAAGLAFGYALVLLLTADTHREESDVLLSLPVTSSAAEAGPSGGGQGPEQAAAPVQSQPVPGIEQQWRSYRVESGKTMAQLFRDHNLPPTDVYAMAQVEGAGKPLSNLQNGQMVQIRQNASGVVTGLTIDSGNGQQVLFTRQADGSFVRAK